VGLLADGSYGEGWNGVEGPVRGLFFGDAGQLVAQLVGVFTNVVVCFGLSLLFFVVVERLHGNRVSQEAEMSGLDAAEIGSDAYHSG
jgi:Amt family ammonium transporter